MRLAVTPACARAAPSVASDWPYAAAVSKEVMPAARDAATVALAWGWPPGRARHLVELLLLGARSGVNHQVLGLQKALAKRFLLDGYDPSILVIVCLCGKRGRDCSRLGNLAAGSIDLDVDEVFVKECVPLS